MINQPGKQCGYILVKKNKKRKFCFNL